ncbi:transcriptional regulator GutM [Pantoea allii]|uniref:transcriptional regulator GutM n=1 Tax=Pantoea allii TaxID=574096 RepID=UPI0039774041
MSSGIIAVALLAWLAHTLFGWYQLRSFNRMLDGLFQQGRVGIGRSASTRFNVEPRVIIALAVDTKGRIISAVIMKGFTVLARPRALPLLNGCYLNDIDAKKIFPERETCQKALLSAISMKE